MNKTKDQNLRRKCTKIYKNNFLTTIFLRSENFFIFPYFWEILTPAKRSWTEFFKKLPVCHFWRYLGGSVAVFLWGDIDRTPCICIFNISDELYGGPEQCNDLNDAFCFVSKYLDLPLEWRNLFGPKNKVSSHEKLVFRSDIQFLFLFVLMDAILLYLD